MATTQPAASPIRAMHDRYEAASADYEAAERAEADAKREDDNRQFAFERAMTTITQESDALRHAILHQVPDTWAEAMVLQFHITSAADLVLNSTEPPTELEKETLLTALDTLLDFMCCEVDQDHAAIGAAFQAGANRVHLQRRYRTGEVEG